MTEYRVGSIIRTNVPTLAPRTPIRRAVALLVDAAAAAALVIGDDGRLTGILTQKDCFRPALHASYHRDWTGCVADHMTREVVSVDAQDELIRVAEMFVSYPHRVFPVLEGDKVAGLVYRSDVLALLMRIG
jgi:CBS domain-containing protein